MSWPPGSLAARTDASPATPDAHAQDHTDERAAINALVAATPYVPASAYITADGTTDDTAGMAAAIAATPTDGTLILPRGDIKIATSGGFTINKRMRMIGQGPELGTRFVATAAVGAHPCITVAPGAGLHHSMLCDFAVDGTANTTAGAVGIRLQNFDNFDAMHVKARGFDVPWDIFDMAICHFQRCDAYNPLRSGFRLNTTAQDTKGVNIWFEECQVYQTSGSATAFAGWEVLGARDVHWDHSYALRSPGIAATMQWGVYISLASGSFGGFMFSGSEFDGVEDGSAAGSSGTCAALYMKNAAKVQADSLWLSAAPGGENKHPALWIDGGSEFYFGPSCRYSGDAAIVLRNAPSALSFYGSVPATCTTAIFDIDAASPPTGLSYDLFTALTSAPISNDLTGAFATAQSRRTSNSPRFVTRGGGTGGVSFYNQTNLKEMLFRIEDGLTGNLAVTTASGGSVLARILQSGGFGFGAGNALRAGTGTPEGAITAPVGSVWLRSDGGTGTTLYIKESGTGNTGWVAK